MAGKQWKVPQVKVPKYSKEQRRNIERYESALARQLAKKPSRYDHSLMVAATAEAMAVMYHLDPYEARVAGILHDWAKAYEDHEQRERAHRLGVDLGVDPHLVTGLLHGYVAARELPGLFPELSPNVLQAIERHTTGAVGMSRLDMVVFTADGIEPRRRDVPAIRATRALLEAKKSLREVFWSSFSQGIEYVIQTGRYLWPGTLDVYNWYVTH